MSKTLAVLLTDLTEAVYGYPKQVVTVDPKDKSLIEVDNRYVEDALQVAIDCLKEHHTTNVPHTDQLSFDL